MHIDNIIFVCTAMELRTTGAVAIGWPDRVQPLAHGIVMVKDGGGAKVNCAKRYTIGCAAHIGLVQIRPEDTHSTDLRSVTIYPSKGWHQGISDWIDGHKIPTETVTDSSGKVRDGMMEKMINEVWEATGGAQWMDGMGWNSGIKVPTVITIIWSNLGAEVSCTEKMMGTFWGGHADAKYHEWSQGTGNGFSAHLIHDIAVGNEQNYRKGTISVGLSQGASLMLAEKRGKHNVDEGSYRGSAVCIWVCPYYGGDKNSSGWLAEGPMKFADGRYGKDLYILKTDDTLTPRVRDTLNRMHFEDKPNLTISEQTGGHMGIPGKKNWEMIADHADKIIGEAREMRKQSIKSGGQGLAMMAGFKMLATIEEDKDETTKLQYLPRLDKLQLGRPGTLGSRRLLVWRDQGLRKINRAGKRAYEYKGSKDKKEWSWYMATATEEARFREGAYRNCMDILWMQHIDESEAGCIERSPLDLRRYGMERPGGTSKRYKGLPVPGKETASGSKDAPKKEDDEEKIIRNTKLAEKEAERTKELDKEKDADASKQKANKEKKKALVKAKEMDAKKKKRAKKAEPATIDITSDVELIEDDDDAQVPVNQNEGQNITPDPEDGATKDAPSDNQATQDPTGVDGVEVTMTQIVGAGLATQHTTEIHAQKDLDIISLRTAVVTQDDTPGGDSEPIEEGKERLQAAEGVLEEGPVGTTPGDGENTDKDRQNSPTTTQEAVPQPSGSNQCTGTQNVGSSPDTEGMKNNDEPTKWKNIGPEDMEQLQEWFGRKRKDRKYTTIWDEIVEKKSKEYHPSALPTWGQLNLLLEDYRIKAKVADDAQPALAYQIYEERNNVTHAKVWDEMQKEFEEELRSTGTLFTKGPIGILRERYYKRTKELLGVIRSAAKQKHKIGGIYFQQCDEDPKKFRLRAAEGKKIPVNRLILVKLNTSKITTHSGMLATDGGECFVNGKGKWERVRIELKMTKDAVPFTVEIMETRASIPLFMDLKILGEEVFLCCFNQIWDVLDAITESILDQAGFLEAEEELKQNKRSPSDGFSDKPTYRKRPRTPDGRKHSSRDQEDRSRSRMRRKTDTGFRRKDDHGNRISKNQDSSRSETSSEEDERRMPPEKKASTRKGRQQSSETSSDGGHSRKTRRKKPSPARKRKELRTADSSESRSRSKDRKPAGMKHPKKNPHVRRTPSASRVRASRGRSKHTRQYRDRTQSKSSTNEDIGSSQELASADEMSRKKEDTSGKGEDNPVGGDARREQEPKTAEADKQVDETMSLDDPEEVEFQKKVRDIPDMTGWTLDEKRTYLMVNFSGAMVTARPVRVMKWGEKTGAMFCGMPNDFADVFVARGDFRNGAWNFSQAEIENKIILFTIGESKKGMVAGFNAMALDRINLTELQVNLGWIGLGNSKIAVQLKEAARKIKDDSVALAHDMVDIYKQNHMLRHSLQAAQEIISLKFSKGIYTRVAEEFEQRIRKCEDLALSNDTKTKVGNNRELWQEVRDDKTRTQRWVAKIKEEHLKESQGFGGIPGMPSIAPVIKLTSRRTGRIDQAPAPVSQEQASSHRDTPRHSIIAHPPGMHPQSQKDLAIAACSPIKDTKDSSSRTPMLALNTDPFREMDARDDHKDGGKFEKYVPSRHLRDVRKTDKEPIRLNLERMTRSGADDSARGVPRGDTRIRSPARGPSDPRPRSRQRDNRSRRDSGRDNRDRRETQGHQRQNRDVRHTDNWKKDVRYPNVPSRNTSRRSRSRNPDRRLTSAWDGTSHGHLQQARGKGSGGKAQFGSNWAPRRNY